MNVCRPGGVLEQYSVYRHELGMNAPVMVMAKYPMVITKDNLYPALKHLIFEDNMLAVNVKLNSKPELYVLNSIDLDLTVRFKPELVVRDNLTSIFNDLVAAHQIPYDQENLPLWRIIVAEERYVIFYFDHSAFDGNSARYFHENLLKYLRSDLKKPMSDDIDPSLALPNTKPLIPPMEILTKAGPPIMYFLKFMYKEMIVNKIWPKDPYCWTGAPPILPWKSNIAFRHISKERSSEYLKLSRANSTTITGLFTATLLATVRSYIPESYVDSEKGTSNISYGMAVNCRGRTPIEDFKQFGNLASAYFDKISVEETPTNAAILTLAQTIVSRLRKVIATGEYRYIMGVLRYFVSSAFLKDSMKKPRPSLVDVSSLGTFDCDEPFEEAYFGQTCSSLGACYCMSLVGSKNGSISVSLSAVDDDAEQLLSDFMTRLESLTE